MHLLGRLQLPQGDGLADAFDTGNAARRFLRAWHTRSAVRGILGAHLAWRASSLRPLLYAEPTTARRAFT